MTEKENKPCKFCETLSELKKYAEARKEDTKCVDKFTIAIADEIYQGKILKGRVYHGGYILNFCPTCGKILNNEEE